MHMQLKKSLNSTAETILYDSVEAAEAIDTGHSGSL